MPSDTVQTYTQCMTPSWQDTTIWHSVSIQSLLKVGAYAPVGSHPVDTPDTYGFN